MFHVEHSPIFPRETFSVPFFAPPQPKRGAPTGAPPPASNLWPLASSSKLLFSRSGEPAEWTALPASSRVSSSPDRRSPVLHVQTGQPSRLIDLQSTDSRTPPESGARR